MESSTRRYNSDRPAFRLMPRSQRVHEVFYQHPCITRLLHMSVVNKVSIHTHIVGDDGIKVRDNGKSPLHLVAVVARQLVGTSGQQHAAVGPNTLKQLGSGNIGKLFDIHVQMVMNIHTAKVLCGPFLEALDVVLTVAPRRSQ